MENTEIICIHRYMDPFIYYRLDKLYVKLVSHFSLLEYIYYNDDNQKFIYPYRPALHKEYIFYLFEKLKQKRCGIEVLEVCLNKYNFVVLFDSEQNAYIYTKDFDSWRTWVFNSREELFNVSEQHLLDCEKHESSERYFYNIWLQNKLLHSE